jgi:catechol 2,3-dioxygenase-like lactoylglutathione lyase family enzyme
MQFGYTVLFVPDVAAAVAFYDAAFGLKAKMVNQAFGMLDTGSTTLAFGWEENERKELIEAGSNVTFRPNSPDGEPAGIQISLVAENVQTAYNKALGAGAIGVYPPRQMPWGQWVSRVRDLNGVLVSIVTAPRF